jgi:hypothetical protein
MATGDVNDFIGRIKSVLPRGWFPAAPSAGQATQTPVLDALLTGISTMWAWLYSLVMYAFLQVRISTATDIFLDLISMDYFGTGLPRNPNEADAAFATRIKANLFPALQTRAAIIAGLTNLTGRAPTIFMPADTGDAGGYNTGAFAYNTAGGYGSLALPAQFFVTAYRQKLGGVPSVAGYSGNESTPQYAPGGYGVGAVEYITPAMAGTQTQDAQIYAEVAKLEAAGTIGWTRISN